MDLIQHGLLIKNTMTKVNIATYLIFDHFESICFDTDVLHALHNFLQEQRQLVAVSTNRKLLCITVR